MLINVIFIESIDIFYGDSRIINYAGLVRGGTQLLIKQELANNQNDELIGELSSIISELRGNKDKNNLTLMEDTMFQEMLSGIEYAWYGLVNEIYRYRIGLIDYDTLYRLSEEYFELTNKLVFDAKKYSEAKMNKMISLKPWIIGSVTLTITIYIVQMISTAFLNSKNKKLERLVYIDTLTRLPNRAKLDEIIDKYSVMKPLPQLACVYIDLNNLKETNDSLGHSIGDKLLKDFSNILREISKNYGFLCRNGGDEFIGIFKGCYKEHIDEFVNMLDHKVNSYNEMEGEIKITYACGISFSNESKVETIYDLLTIADKRMYIDKNLKKIKMEKGKNI